MRGGRAAPRVLRGGDRPLVGDFPAVGLTANYEVLTRDFVVGTESVAVVPWRARLRCEPRPTVTSWRSASETRSAGTFNRPYSQITMRREARGWHSNALLPLRSG